jgi:hypothetical protein
VPWVREGPIWAPTEQLPCSPSRTVRVREFFFPLVLDLFCACYADSLSGLTDFLSGLADSVSGKRASGGTVNLNR